MPPFQLLPTELFGLKPLKPPPNVMLSAAKHLDLTRTLVMLREILRYAQDDSQDASFDRAARRNIFGSRLAILIAARMSAGPSVTYGQGPDAWYAQSYHDHAAATSRTASVRATTARITPRLYPA
jgi:hypothetical protein